MKKFFADWRVCWLLILLPVALFLPALPIDETRYLSVAWELRNSPGWLLLHLNGEPYSHKGPLLFWLINIAWTAAGLNVWIVRLGMLVVSLALLLLFERLVRRLDADDPALATRAAQIFAGMLFFAIFASAIMFDVVLAACVLLALHGLVDFDERRWGRGVAVFATGLSLGLLNKGPVMLLDAGLVGLLGPWWSATARSMSLRWYAAVFAGVFASVAVGFVYMASAGGWSYVTDVVLHQTAARMTQSFAHARPVWWYFMVLPLMILPWTLSLRAPWRAWRAGFALNKAARFAAAWFVPAFVIFCFASGKQPHYLLPLLPGLALYFAIVLRDGEARVRGRVFGALLVLAGVFLLAVPWLAQHAAHVPGLDRLVRDGSFSPREQGVIGGMWLLWGALAAALGVFLLAHPRAHARVGAVALCAVATAAIGMLTIAQVVGPTLDVTAVAKRIRATQEAGTPIAHLGWHHGLFEFPGRMTQPLEAINLGELYVWCAAHPDGEVVTIYSKYGVPTKAETEVPWRLGSILFWRASEVCAGPRAAPQAKPEEDDRRED
ncbi:MAG: glycosyl transferase [Rudaea sp.]|uniref:ArnT family glycosyltransferase n=1 Tax=Rudaea sp. TaxID=2136325 RepID=UPI0039E353AC